MAEPLFMSRGHGPVGRHARVRERGRISAKCCRHTAVIPWGNKELGASSYAAATQVNWQQDHSHPAVLGRVGGAA